MDFGVGVVEPSGSGTKSWLVNAGNLSVTTSQASFPVQKQQVF
jgi:hypothetical protein